MSLDMPNMNEIVELAKILRKNGDQVLNGSSKLSLSTKLLQNLNEGFSLIIDDSKDLESSFQVCNSSEIEIFRDLKFLHDFIQKTVWLKMVHTSADGSIPVDISKFRHLKYLELQKVCIDLVKGIQGIRGQLESISCSGGGGVGTIGRLLTACGGDAGVGFVWASLKRLSLPYNSLGRLDKSLELAPWLQTLDLSHNLITSASELDCLPSLKYVNLSYNRLETVPVFNKATYRNLQILILKNNYIESLNSLHGLDCLSELDLSYNCLADHSALWPLAGMSALLWLALEGNPLSYHSKHRIITMKYLHSSLAESKFVLDHEPLSKSEKVLVNDKKNSSSSSLTCELNTAVRSTNQMSAFNNSYMSTGSERSWLSSKKRSTNVQEVNIADSEIEKDKAEENTMFVSSVETSMDHLETKKKILALREKFGGDNWLSNQAGSYVQDIMGIERMPNLTTAVELSENFDDLSNSEINLISSSHDENFKSDETAEENVENLSEDKDTEFSEIFEATDMHENEPPYDLEAEEGELFLVRKRIGETEEMEEVFLIITDKNITERDSVSRKIKYQWSIDTVLSCVMGRGEVAMVDLIFDTTRRDWQSRSYFTDAEDAENIVQIIGKSIKTQQILLKIFKCMKCSTHFSQDSDYLLDSTSTNRPPTCPLCKSTLVIQTDELLTPGVDNSMNVADEGVKSVSSPDNTQDFPENSSHSSIGSAASLEDSHESTPLTAMKKYESIEVLSNPSQSSIEVLDDGSKSSLTPKRKRSSEERRIAIAPTLLTIPDISSAAGLPESGSSGSLNDSASKKAISDSEQADLVQESGKESSQAPVTNLSSMLGGLLQSMKIGTNKRSPIKSEEEVEFFGSDIQYSYTNFTSVDHRIKLYLILNVFELENEEIILFLRTEILMQQTIFPGCLILSTAKIYILRIIGPENEDPQRWLHKEISWTMDRLRIFAPLPFKQGVLVELEQPNKFNGELSTFTLLCILQDFQRTSNFLFYLTELPLPASCEVQFSVSEQSTASIHNLMTLSRHYHSGDVVRIFAIFSSATLQVGTQKIETNIAGLLVTTSSLIITEDKINWLLPNSSESPVKMTEQSISNLIEVISDGQSLGLNFLDEVVGIEELWTLVFVSAGAAEAVINAIQSPWEELFSVPLQITKINSKNDQQT